MTSAERPVVRMSGLTRAFGPTIALRGVDLEVAGAEIHALIGENGAGKSTLMKILCGALHADAGTMLLNGTPYRPRNPLQARRCGVAMIHQELMLAPELSVERNVLLGVEAAHWGWVPPRRNRSRARALLARLGHAGLPLDVAVRKLGMAERQIVEIARALAGDPRVLVMDEPTSSLGPADTEALFAVIRGLRDSGVSVIYISHVLEECVALCDRFTVLRDGTTAAAGTMRRSTLPDIVRAMIGRDLDQVFPPVKEVAGTVALRAMGLSGTERPHGVDLTVRRGEVLGLAGQVGAGRTETLRALFGLNPLRAGCIELGGQPYRRPSPGRSLRRGLGLLSENRKEEGLLLGRSVADNVTLSRLEGVSRWGLVNGVRQRRAARRALDRLGLAEVSVAGLVRRLSGGNQQKVALARLLHQDAEVLLLDEPTRGIDVASKLEIYRVMRELAAQGKAIMFVSSQSSELLGVCDTIAVLHRGRVVASRPAAAWSEHELLRASLGPADGTAA